VAPHALLTGPSPDTRPALVLEAGPARVAIDAAAGGRIGSLVVHGRELLSTSGEDAIHWGSFPMAPFAGRVRDARFDFAGRTYQLEPTFPPHAIHGTVLDRPWDVIDPVTIEIELGPGWPFRGRVVQRFALAADRLTVTMELHADEPMPGALGWHPWFRRRLEAPAGAEDAAAARSSPVRLHLDAAHMLRRDADGISGRHLVPPTAGPWDDCFTGLRRPPMIEWPGTLALELSSPCPFWVVFDEEPQAVCVEPQTEPPNELNHDPAVVEPGEPLVATMTWRWWRP
jgi:aldose 1-epimerase